ncbi:hypothetical protein ABZ502_17720 [Streptomyces abikoensis]|uniref:hypothetical protein n=1 Tax=Streptomyces abikoensis TaxID=97398 RepID=UPI0033D4B463
MTRTDWGRWLGGKADAAKVTTARTTATRTEARAAAGRVGALSDLGKRGMRNRT